MKHGVSLSSVEIADCFRLCSQKAVKMLLDNGESLGGVGAGRRKKEVAVTRDEFLAFAEQHGSIISVYQVL